LQQEKRILDKEHAQTVADLEAERKAHKRLKGRLAGIFGGGGKRGGGGSDDDDDDDDDKSGESDDDEEEEEKPRRKRK